MFPMINARHLVCFLFSSLLIENVQSTDQSYLAQSAGIAGILNDLYGRGLVIENHLEGNTASRTFWQVNDSDGGVRVVAQPREFFSRFFLVAGPQNNTVYVRLGDFQYICMQPDHSVKAIPREQFQAEESIRATCMFVVSGVGSWDFISDSGNAPVLLQSVSSQRFLAGSGPGTPLQAVPDINNASPFLLQDERDVIVDLGIVEQFAFPNFGPDNPAVLFKVPNGNFVEIRRDAPNRATIIRADETQESAYWFIRRSSRLSNRIQIRSVLNDRWLCSRPDDGNILNSYPSFVAGRCEFIPVRLNGHQIALLHVFNDRYVRVSDGRAQVDARFAQAATPFELLHGDARNGATYEIIHVEFDALVTESIPFVPEEVKTISFRNDSPADQQQLVDLSKERTITTETTWSVAFAVSTTVSAQVRVGFGPVRGQLGMSTTIGFSADTGRTFSRQETIGIQYAKTFTVPACTAMTITIGTAAGHRTTVPFIATLRKNRVDGTSEIVRQTGSQTGVLIDQTQVSVQTTPVPGCVAGTGGRRLLRGSSGSSGEDS